ncbi:MAG: putative RNA methyltransferase [Legionellaceae bacterium]
MPTVPFELLRCPIDGNMLTRNDKRWCCEVGHSFDTAREGYVHLLPVQHKRSKNPGDSKEMVMARRRFLSAGHYAPIALALANMLASHTQGSLSCLDAGCGEGYYLRELQNMGMNLSILGLDISKWAVQAAAKLDKSSTWVVGSNANLPVISSTIDFVLCLFGFPIYSEFARVLKPGGLLVQIDTGEQHLRELREVIYPTLKPIRERTPPLGERLALIEERALSFEINLKSGEAIADLLTMTPHLYRTNQEGKKKAAALHNITLSIDVHIKCFQRDQA